MVSVNLIESYLIFCFKSKSYLRQQVRRMVKKLIEVGMKELEFDEFLELFNISKEISYQPANPEGLILWDILYNDNCQFVIDTTSKTRMIRYLHQKEEKSNLKRILFHVLQHNNIS